MTDRLRPNSVPGGDAVTPATARASAQSREAFQLAGSALASLDAAGRIVTVNPAFERLVGGELSELVGRRLDELWVVSMFDPDGALHDELESGGAVHVDALPRAGVDDIPACSLRIVALRERAGSAVRFGVQVERQDESAHRFALSTDPRGLRLSFDQLVVPMATILPDGRVSSANAAYTAMLGREPAELDEIDIFTLIHPDDRAGDMAEGVRAYAGESDGWTREKRFLHADGSAVWVIETVTLVRDDAGDPLHFLCQEVDITERRDTEARLRESEERYRSLADGLPLGLLRTDRWGHINEANPAMALLFGGDPVGRHVVEIIHPEDVDRVALSFFESAGRGQDWLIEFRILEPTGGIRWIRAHGRAHRGVDGEVAAAMSIWQDVTELKQVEDELRERATTDSLTGLPNRAIFYDRLAHSLALSPRSNTRVAVLFVDLDKFKPVNDDWGHAAGDRLLRLVGERLASCVRDGDTLARVGGDEFMVLAESIVAVDTARRIAERIVEAMTEPFLLPEGQAHIGASVGLAVSGPRSTPETLVHASDVALYRAKAGGGGRVVLT